MKGVSPLIGMVLVIAFGFVAMGIVLAVVNPLLDRAKDSGIVNEATQNMQLIDSVIKAVASEAKGSKRTVHVKITEGVLRSNSTADWVYLDFEPKTRTILDGFSGDVKIESRPVFLEYFNQYSEGANANGTWTAINGTWSISSGRFLGSGGIAYSNVGNQQAFDLAATIVRSTAPDGQVYVVPGDPRDIVLFLPFDGNVNTTVTTAYDYSAYKNNGTLFNTTAATCFTNKACPSWVTGQFGNATEFDGIGDTINVTHNNVLDFYNSTSFTLNFWLKFTSLKRQFVFDTRDTGVDGWTIETSAVGTTINMGGRDDDNTGFPASGVSITDTDWHFYSFVLDRGNGLSTYKDGVLGNGPVSLTGIDNLTETSVFTMGNIVGGGFPCNCTLDEVMIFKRALTSDEIKFLYASSIKKITTAGEIPSISPGTSGTMNTTIVLAAPGSSYFDNIKLKAGPVKIRLVVPYQNIDIETSARFGPGDHNIVIENNGTNTTTNKRLIRITG